MSGRILIVDDHQAVRRGLRSLLSTRPEWKICGEATDGLDAIEKVKVLRPDVVLMDVSMPRMDGIAATRIIKSEFPESKVVIVSQNDPEATRRQAQEVRAAAYVDKSALSTDLLVTLDRVFGVDGPPNKSNADVIPRGASSPQWLSGGGEMGRLIRQYDWSKTSLGPLERWPQSLKTSVNLIINSQHPMWIGWGPECIFLYNDAYIRVLSTAKHPAALGKPAAEVWPEIWDICGPLAEKVLQDGEASFFDDVRLFMNRGDYLEETYYSFSYSPIRDESGKIVGLFCPSTDVTPKVINARRLHTLSELSTHALTQKTTEAACASAAATLATNSDDIPFAALYLIDREADRANLEQTCGIARGLPGLTPESIDLAGSQSSSRWPIAAMVKGAQSQTVSVKNAQGLPLGPAQQALSEAVVLRVTSRGDDRPVGVLVAGVNPTRGLDAEYRTFYELAASQIATAIQNARGAEEERKRLEALAEIDRAKTAFFSNVSHEFRTPLTLMLGPVEDLLARSHTDLPPAAKRQLELVNRNGARLLRLVNTLLDFSRIEAGRMKAVFQPTNLGAFTLELASVFRSATEKAGIRLELDCPELPEPVFIDRDMWEKIVLNLISNAFKFTFEGTISVSLAKRGDGAELRVRDTGVGIPEQEVPRLFDRFHRVENTRSRTHEGSGIGLALVQELVKLHGGAVRAESVLDQGSVFVVTVPLGFAHLPAERIGKARTLASTALGAAPFVEEALRWLPDTIGPEVEAESVAGRELLPVPCPPGLERENAFEKRPLILVADDNADMRQYLTRLLEERYEVEAVPDGQAALASVQDHRPDLILTDVMMPRLDGFGFLRELRSDVKTRTIPIIVLSARAGEESRVEGMQEGADDYLIKPFSARELLARVHTHLELARVRKQSEEALSRRTAQFETLLNEAPLGVYLVDSDFRIQEMNPRARQVFGDSLDLIGNDFEEVIHVLWPKEYADEIVDRFRHTLRTGEPYIVAERIEERRDLGIREVYEWQVNRIVLPHGGYGVVCYFRDISRLVEARETIAQSTAKFRAVFEQTPVFAGIMSLDGTIIDANRLCLDACGYRADDVLGHLFWETGWWRKSANIQSKVQAATLAAARGIPTRETLTYHWADGTERLMDFAIHPILDDQGQILFLHPTGVDITDLKRAEGDYRALAETLDAEVRVRTSELEQRNVEVEQQSELLRNFSRRLLRAQDEERRRIARELHDSSGQILAALGMSLTRLTQQSQETNFAGAKEAEESQELVQQLSQEIRTMSYLLHPPLLDEIGLSEALHWYIQGLTERSGLDIKLVVSEDFGRLPREMELVIFRLVQECLTNIHRHSESKSAEIHMSRQHGNIALEVIDQGKGIPADKLAQIQGHSSGVGIRGMNERVRQFNGQMNIASSGKGTIICFSFPLLEPEAERAVEQLPATG